MSAVMLAAGTPEPLDLLALPKSGVHRVQEDRWSDVWGPAREKLSARRRWMRERLALLNIRPLGNRYADPLGHYKETYGSTCLVGALLEIWADDVPDEATVIAGTKVRRTSWDPVHSVGVLPAARIEGRVVIRMWTPAGRFVDVSTVRTRTWLVRQRSLRGPLATARAVGPRLDPGLLEGSGARSRIMTQNVGRALYQLPSEVTGVGYRTRLGGPTQNWAIFDKS